MSSDPVIVETPATVEFLPVLRRAGAQLAVIEGCDLDRIEDHRIAIGEAVRILVGSGDQPTDSLPNPLGTRSAIGRLRMIWQQCADGWSVGIERTGTGTGGIVPELSIEILAGTTDDFRLERSPERVTLHYRREAIEGG